MKNAQFLQSSGEIGIHLGKADFKSVSGTLLTSVRAEKDTQGLN
jgi:hypothetical protein